MHRNALFLLKSVAKLPLIPVVKGGDPWQQPCYAEQYIAAGFASAGNTALEEERGCKWVPGTVQSTLEGCIVCSCCCWCLTRQP